jgi:hypothetical protein
MKTNRDVVRGAVTCRRPAIGGHACTTGGRWTNQHVAIVVHTNGCKWLISKGIGVCR